jgi:hypothetical protein
LVSGLIWSQTELHCTNVLMPSRRESASRWWASVVCW